MGGVAGKGDVEIISPAQFSKPGPERAVFTYTIQNTSQPLPAMPPPMRDGW